MTRCLKTLSAAMLAFNSLAALGALAQTGERQPSAKMAGDHLECADGTLAPKTPEACAGRGGIAQHVHISSHGTTVVPESRTVLCRDGTTMARKEGACAEHGGPAAPLSPTPAPSASPNESAPRVSESAPNTPRESPPSSVSSEGKPDESRRGTGGSGTAGAAAPSDSSATPGTTNVPVQPGANGPAPKATAHCRDGTPWFGGRSDAACSEHGGVEQWLDETR